MDAYIRLLELLLQTPAGVLLLLFLGALLIVPAVINSLQLKSYNRQTQVWSTLIGDLVASNQKHADALERLDDLLEAQKGDGVQIRQMMENVTTALVALTDGMGKRFDETIEIVGPLPGKADETLAGVGAVQASLQSLQESQGDILQAVQAVRSDVQRLCDVVEAQGEVAQADELRALARRVEDVLADVQRLRVNVEQATNMTS